MRQEIADVRCEAEAYRLEFVDLSPALKGSLLAPQGDRRWALTLLQEYRHALEVRQVISQLVQLKLFSGGGRWNSFKVSKQVKITLF